MIRGPGKLWEKFDRWLVAEEVPRTQQGEYRKWLRFYLDFCNKYNHEYANPASLAPFTEKPASKRQTKAQREQAKRAVELYYRMIREKKAGGGEQGTGKDDAVCENTGAYEARPTERTAGKEKPIKRRREAGETSGTRRRSAEGGGVDQRAVETDLQTAEQGVGTDFQAAGQGASWRAEFAALVEAIEMRHYSPRTLKTYRTWIRKLQAFTKSKPPEELSVEDVKAFLSDLAVNQQVAASTQNQAFNALLFFFRHVLNQEFGEVDGVVRAKRRKPIPVVLSRAEVDAVIAQLKPPYDLVVKLLYGCGLRISECLELRVGCFNLDAKVLTVRDGKGRKDRTVPLPDVLIDEIRDRFKQLASLHRSDLNRGYAGVFLPAQLEKKYRKAPRRFVWQWFFPASRLTHVKQAGEYRRYHLQPSHATTAIREAVQAAAIPKRVTPHTFRHTFASHLLRANYDIRTIQKLLGHSDVKTTMIYTHTVRSVTVKEAKSPLDLPGDIRED